MSATYEVWLTDDSGVRLSLFGDLAFFSYTRAVEGLGTIQFGMPRGVFPQNPFFLTDWRAEVWRSPADGIPLRREGVYLLRKPELYQRAEDGLEIIKFYGRSGLDLLYRRAVIQRDGSQWATKTDYLDDMLKDIVREQMLYGSAVDEDGASSAARMWPQNEFFVQADVSQGPTITRSFAGRMVADVLKDLHNASRQLHEENSASAVIYYDVVPVDIGGYATAGHAALGWEFRTYTNLRGQDRRTALEFSAENENLQAPDYWEDHLDEVTAVYVTGNGRGANQIITSVTDANRLASSRWNRVEKVISASNENSTTALQTAGKGELWNRRPQERLQAVILNSPGSRTTPRSLYGVDWDLGDLVRATYAGKSFDMEIKLVYVSVDENGKETITGRNEIQ